MKMRRILKFVGFVVFISFLGCLVAYTKTSEAAMLEKNQVVNEVSPAYPSTVPDVSETKNSSAHPTTVQSSSKNLESEERSSKNSASTSMSQSSETKESKSEDLTSEKSSYPNVKSTTTETPQERIDTSFAGNNWLMSIGGGYAGNAGTDGVSLLGSKSIWTFEYMGADIDAYRINKDNTSLRIFWGNLKRVSGNDRNSREAYWKFVKVPGGVKIENVAYSSKCLSASYFGLNSSVTFSNWSNLNTQIWTLSKSNYNYAQKVFYIPVNTTENIDSGNASNDTVWFRDNSKIEEGNILHVTPTSDDLSLKEYVAKRGNEEIRRVYVIPVQYNFVNQVNFSKYIDVNSPVKSYTLPEELTIPATVVRYNDQTELFDKYRISSINQSAFKGAPIKKVSFGDGLDYIQSQAFASSGLEVIQNISSSTWLGGDSFTGTHVRDIVTDEPEKFVRNTSKTVFNNYKGQKTTVWKKGEEQTFTTSYGSEVLSSYNLHEKENLSLSLNVSYPEGTQLRYPLEDTTTSFKDAKECWQSYHSYQWYKDGVKLANQNTPVLKLSSLKSTDSGSYYATVDGQRVEEGKDIKVKVKVENTNPSSPEPANPNSWINVSVPVSLEFHSSSDDYTKIEGNSEKLVNHSGRAVKILVSHVIGQSDFKNIENLKLRALKGSNVDLKNFEEGKEVELVTLGNVTSTSKNSSVSIEGDVDSRVRQVSKYKLNLVLKFRPLNQNGQPYS